MPQRLHPSRLLAIEHKTQPLLLDIIFTTQSQTDLIIASKMRMKEVSETQQQDGMRQKGELLPQIPNLAFQKEISLGVEQGRANLSYKGTSDRDDM